MRIFALCSHLLGKVMFFLACKCEYLVSVRGGQAVDGRTECYG